MLDEFRFVFSDWHTTIDTDAYVTVTNGIQAIELNKDMTQHRLLVYTLPEYTDPASVTESSLAKPNVSVSVIQNCNAWIIRQLARAHIDAEIVRGSVS